MRGGMKSNHKLVIAVIAGSTAIVGGAIILCVFYIYYYRRKSQRQNVFRLSCLESDKTSGGSCRAPMMDFKKIESATDNFRETNILGAGGFGCVYQGHLQPANISVAVKKLSNADAITQFQTEVELLSKIEHPNIITLLGYCIHGETRLLVYQLMHNGSLETQLHGPSKGSALTWHLRLKIALDVARCVCVCVCVCVYAIHIACIESVLFDQLSDFGLAILDGSQKKSQLKLSGTLGYVAPEYLLDGKLTDKSDVYGFGVVLLELLLGRKPMEKPAPPHTQSTVSWAMPQLTDRTKLPNIVDPVIANSMDMKHLYQVAAVALLCIQPEPSYRPLIADILLSLVPLVPVELGGTLRDEKSLKPSTYVHA
ncbi:hypothetical protein SASPL_123309 [Salvia splendens]|uniref:Protein kinase domain-containing protein n=1 Tax=Salvia splendens TaxID=180675 RepID=A0A8X8XK52_SALSN|nr:hypothetical protein SASPL_123309 [Salvia splendens]